MLDVLLYNLIKSKFDKAASKLEPNAIKFSKGLCHHQVLVELLKLDSMDLANIRLTDI